MRARIDTGRLIVDVLTIAEEHPATRYAPLDGSGCVYFDPVDGAPSCLIGHALARQGITISDLTEPVMVGGRVQFLALNATGIHHVVAPGVSNAAVDDPRVLFLRLVQLRQDEGTSWGVAAAAARRAALAACRAWGAPSVERLLRPQAQAVGVRV